MNYNAYLADAGPVAELTSRKLRLQPRDLGYPSVVVSRHVPEVLASGRRLLQGMGMTGFANVEFKRDTRDGSYALMEVNGRPNMSGMLALRCGTNFPLITYRDLVLGELPNTGVDREYEQGVYWINESADLRGAAASVKAGRLSFRKYVEPYVRTHTFAGLSASDPLPFLVRLVSKVRSTVKGSRGEPTNQSVRTNAAS